MPTGPSRRLAGVVLNFRTPDDTLAAVRSLLASTRPFDDIIVVDNDNAPGCADQVMRIGAPVRYLAAGRNLGFSGGMNLGISSALLAGAGAILLVNSDATLTPECAARLEHRLNARVGLVGPVVRGPDDAVISCGIDYAPRSGRMRERQASPTDATEIEVAAVSGCVLLVAREVWDTVGLLDVDYFFSFEDIDFCLRARAAGFATVVAANAVAHHRGSRTIGADSPRRLYFAARNHLLVASRVSPAGRFTSMLRTSSIVSLNVAHAVRSGHGTLVQRLRAVFRGTRDYFQRRFGEGSHPEASTPRSSEVPQLQVQSNARLCLPVGQDHAVILMYHRIARSGNQNGSHCVTPDHFRSHLRQLREGDYNVVPLQDLSRHLARRTLAPRSVAITFDDGYMDTLTQASPALREFSFPATVFVVSAVLDGLPEFWWNLVDRVFDHDQPLSPVLRLHLDGRAATIPTSTTLERREAHAQIRSQLVALSLSEREGVVNELLDWSGLRPAAASDARPMVAQDVVSLASIPGIEIGAHTVNHLWLPSQPRSVVLDEVITSRNRLEALLSRPVTSFAYPYGAYDEASVGVVRDSGFSVAVTTEQRPVRAGASPFALPRYEVLDRDRLAFAESSPGH
jgi:GT2 family glycosyltransferase/peptidoglycan/xylan/chitin deacetylase (PgdA/CDA1 family)